MDGEVDYSAYANASELVAIVDERNEQICGKSRAEMRAGRLRHRATYVFVRTSAGQLVVQKRSQGKEYCPGYFDPAPGGVVDFDESYEENAYRELEEEMGVTGVPLEHLFTFYYEDQRTKCFGDAWECVSDGPFTLQAEEVESIHYMTPEEILQRHEQGELFTPDGIVALREYIKHKSAS